MITTDNSKIKFYTFAETCGIIRTSPNTLRKALKNGEISGKKLGNRWKFSEQEIIDFGTHTDNPKVRASHKTYLAKNRISEVGTKKKGYTSYREHAKQIGII